MSYATAEYIRTLTDFGAPRTLPHCGGHVLVRPIPGEDGLTDACGPYPLFSCLDWSGLPDDLADLRQVGLVSLALVADPLSAPPEDLLSSWCDGAFVPFKQHHLVDLSVPFDEATSEHHRRYVRRFRRRGAIDFCDSPTELLDTWCDLYDGLIARQGITGPARFARDAFAQQLALPGSHVLRAVNADGQTLGMQIWFSNGHHAWYHLGAQSAAGRKAGASFGLFAAALDTLRSCGVQTVDLGGGAGLSNDPDDGLASFKAGWATGSATAWLCGFVLDPAAYADLVGDDDTAFFPAYRDPARSREVSHAGRD